MQQDLESRYQRTLPDFIRVQPEGFAIGKRLEQTLGVVIKDEQVVRKFWDHGRLACQSIDGFSALTTGKACRVCRHQTHCTPQIILYVLLDQDAHRIALNYTSAQNYFAYRRTLAQNGRELGSIFTLLSVVSHATWAELQFRETL